MEELWLWPGGLQTKVLYRALSYLPHSTVIAFQLAEIEEELGNFEKAHTVLNKMADLEPLCTASLKRLQIEQRRGSGEEAMRNIFEEVYTNMPGIEEASEIALKFSDFQRAKGSYITAKDTLDRALEVDKNNSKLYSAKIKLLTFLDPNEVINVCDEAVASNMTSETKIIFAKQKIDEIEAMGLSLNQVKKAKSEYKDLVKNIHQEKQDKPGLTCEICDVKVSCENALRKHNISMHTGPVNCERCHIDIADKYNLKIHLEKCLWRCSMCPYNSLKKYNITKHEKLKHS